MEGNIWLSPPPQYVLLGEPRPVVEPRMQDQEPPAVPEAIDEWEHFVSDSPPSERLTATRSEEALAAALSNDQVTQVLGDGPRQVIGTSLVAQGEKGDERDAILFVAYDYTDDHAVEVLLSADSLDVLDVTRRRAQPAPVQEEIDRAVALASADPRLAQHVAELIGNAILTTPPDPLDPNYNHRQFDVRFGRSDERLPRYWALVDLSSQAVLRAGSVR